MKEVFGCLFFGRRGEGGRNKVANIRRYSVDDRQKLLNFWRESGTHVVKTCRSNTVPVWPSRSITKYH